MTSLVKKMLWNFSFERNSVKSVDTLEYYLAGRKNPKPSRQLETLSISFSYLV